MMVMFKLTRYFFPTDFAFIFSTNRSFWTNKSIYDPCNECDNCVRLARSLNLVLLVVLELIRFRNALKLIENNSTVSIECTLHK